jgi:glycine cleavage system transcriptional repressor
MQTHIVLTLTGKDRIGIVEDVTKVLLDLGGNIGTSRMTRLGGEFAVLMLVSLPVERVAGLGTAFASLEREGYLVSTSETSDSPDEARTGWVAYRIEVQGADHEGIIHEISLGLSRAGITIESAETRTAPAPTMGTPLFVMSALLLVPPSLVGSEWIADLENAAALANVDVEVLGAE